MDTINNPLPAKFASIDQAAEVLHCCRITVIKRINEGQINAIKNGRKWLIPLTEFDRLAKVG